MQGSRAFVRPRRSACARRSRAPLVVRATSKFEASNPYAQELRDTAKYIAQRGKGILASDESNTTTGKRLASVDVENTFDNRRAWRQVLYTAPGLGNYISGAIMFEETLYQSTADGKQFVDVLMDQGIYPGIKVDTGLEPLPGTVGETATQGLDGLGARMEKYREQGAKFCKWRAVLKINEDGSGPSMQAVTENAHGLARYAQIAQSSGLVPIVEPEVTLGPGTYTIEDTAYWSERVYSHVFRMLNEYDVMLDAILLKPNMILPGLDAAVATPEDVAKYTVRTMMRSVPPAVPGIHFLSGGMSEEESTLNLQTWKGQEENVAAAHDILVKLAKANSEAQKGEYKGPHPVPGGGRILQALRLGAAPS